MTTTPATPATLPAPPLPAVASGAPQPPRWALLLDVDGTLLAFADDPAAVVVDTALRTLLGNLHAALDGSLALVSGRALQDIDRLFGAPHWAAAGLHGWQWRDAAGVTHEHAIDAARQRRLHHAMRALAASQPQARFEDKGVAVAVHCRHAPQLWTALHAACLATLAQLPGYTLQLGNHVMEFKPAGVDKGDAVRTLLATALGTGRMPVYVGDDLTDEDAFVAVNALGGISVRVGTRTPSAARFTLPDPPAVRRWLTQVLAALTPPKTRSAHESDQ